MSDEYDEYIDENSTPTPAIVDNIKEAVMYSNHITGTFTEICKVLTEEIWKIKVTRHLWCKERSS